MFLYTNVQAQRYHLFLISELKWLSLYAKKSLLNRFLYAVLVFCVVWIVQIVMGAITKIGIKGSDTSSWDKCWQQIRK